MPHHFCSGCQMACRAGSLFFKPRTLDCLPGHRPGRASSPSRSVNLLAHGLSSAPPNVCALFASPLFRCESVRHTTSSVFNAQQLGTIPLTAHALTLSENGPTGPLPRASGLTIATDGTRSAAFHPLLPYQAVKARAAFLGHARGFDARETPVERSDRGLDLDTS